MKKTSFFHVTGRENLPSILGNGLLGGWGDDGFGVYVFSDIHDAISYAEDDGWDGSLKDPVIIEIEAEESTLDYIEIDPGWPNPEDYENVRIFRMDPDTPEEESAWRPENIRVLEDAGPGKAVSPSL